MTTDLDKQNMNNSQRDRAFKFEISVPAPSGHKIGIGRATHGLADSMRQAVERQRLGENETSRE